MKKIKNLFLKNSYNDAINYYNELLSNRNETWDIVVVTSSNEMQADIYRMQLEQRKKQKLLPLQTDYYVIPDLEGKRIGSGGATLNVLKILSEKYDLSKKKVLIIHSGGDSKRVPQYSCCGKLFSPVPKHIFGSKYSTIFDELMVVMSNVPTRMDNGVFVMCGDALVLFNSLQIDLQYKKAVAISMKMPKEKGVNHGVFVCDDDNVITEFLHKQPLSILEEKAVTCNTINFDTGMIYFHSDIVIDLLKLIEDKEMFNLFVSDRACLNFYGDFLYPLAKNASLENYLKEGSEKEYNIELEKCRKILWKLLKNYELKICKLSPSLFLHFGTTNELLNIMTQNLEDFYYLDYKKCVASFSGNDVTAINSFVTNSKFGNNVYFEHSCVNNSNVGNNCILSNTVINEKIIPSDVVLSTIKLYSDKYVTRIYGIDCDPKTIINNNTKLFNESNNKILEDYIGIAIWDAPLYSIKNSLDESIEAALRFYRICNNNSTKDDLNLYNNEEKISLSKSFNLADFSSMLLENNKLEEKIIFEKIIDVLKERQNLLVAKNILDSYANKRLIIKKLKKYLNNEDKSLVLRIYYLLYMVCDKDKELYLKESFKVLRDIFCDVSSNKFNYEFNSDKVVIESPVRINLGGGWSDTPPYCIENGGCVLNAAIKLNGEYPISVSIEKIKEKKLIFSCVDFNDTVEVDTIEDLRNCSNPNDSYALLKCAVLISDMIDENDSNLLDLFNRVGAGVKITTNTKIIPRGSGLGTSSILSGTVLKAIYQFMGRSVSDIEICDDVLRLEQLMSTGGGWQDQIGGLTKGIKIIETLPGVKQDFKIRNLNLSNDVLRELNERLLLINTGQRRLARNILRDVMGKYIQGIEDTKNILNNIQILAKDMVVALENDNINLFADKLNEHWKLSKMLDSNCTNTCIDFIFESIEDLIDAKFICGAGGGGFLLILVKEGVTKEDVDTRIKDVFQDIGVSCWSLKIEM